MNIVTAVSRYLKTDTTIQTDATAGVQKHRLEEDIDMSGKVAVVVSRQPNWAHQPIAQCDFPKLRIIVHADCSRDTNGQQKADDARDRALKMFNAVNKMLHWKFRSMVQLGGTGGPYVLGSELYAGPNWVNRPGDEIVMLQFDYAQKVIG